MGFSGKLNRPRYRKCLCDETPETGLSSVPLIAVGIIGLTCYITAMFFSLKDGFKIADMGDHLAAYGTVVLLLVDFSYIFYTLKIMFCIKSNTFPTWPEVRDLRDTIMRLACSFIVGLCLILVAYDWFTEFGHIRETPLSRLETTEGSLRNLNLTNLVTSNSSTLDKNDDNLRRDRFMPIQIVKMPEISSNSTIDRDALSNNKTRNENSNSSEEDHRSYTRDNLPFVSLFFSSFSFCIAGATIIIAAIFEKKCAEELEVLKLRHSDYLLSEETQRLLPASCRHFVPSHGDGVQDYPFATCGHGSGSRSYFQTTEATGMMSEDESNRASTSSPRVWSREPSKFSTYSSDEDSSVARRVRFCEPSRLVNLYPHHGPGNKRYWCSVCNSTLAPVPKVQNHGMSVSTTENKKSPAVVPEGNGVIGQATSNAQASMDYFPADVIVHAEGSQHPGRQKAEAQLSSEPAVIETEEVLLPLGAQPHYDLAPQASHEHRATELFQTTRTIHKGDYIEMTEI